MKYVVASKRPRPHGGRRDPGTPQRADAWEQRTREGPPPPLPFTQWNRQVNGHTIVAVHQADGGQRERLEDADVVDPRETAPQLSDVEQVALVDRQGAAERGVVDAGVAGEVDAPDRMSRSHPDARGHVHRPDGGAKLHFGREIDPALRLGAPSRVEQARAQRVYRRGAGKAHLAQTCRLPGRRNRSDERQAERKRRGFHVPFGPLCGPERESCNRSGPHSGPRPAARAEKTLATSQRLRRRSKGEALGWLDVPGEGSAVPVGCPGGWATPPRWRPL